MQSIFISARTWVLAARLPQMLTRMVLLTSRCKIVVPQTQSDTQQLGMNSAIFLGCYTRMTLSMGRSVWTDRIAAPLAIASAIPRRIRTSRFQCRHSQAALSSRMLLTRNLVVVLSGRQIQQMSCRTPSPQVAIEDAGLCSPRNRYP